MELAVGVRRAYEEVATGQLKRRSEGRSEQRFKGDLGKSEGDGGRASHEDGPLVPLQRQKATQTQRDPEPQDGALRLAKSWFSAIEGVVGNGVGDHAKRQYHGETANDQTRLG